MQWRLPEGWRAGPLQYPVPDRLSIAGLMNYVFERDYALLAMVTIPATAEPGVAFPVDARLDYLVCTEQLCVPETANVTVQLRTAAPAAADPAFAAYRRALPRPLAAAGRFATQGRAGADRDPAAGRDAARRPLRLRRHGRCGRSFGAAELFAERRFADRRDAPPGRWRGRCRRSTAC